jgi:transporter family-2 protein
MNHFLAILSGGFLAVTILMNGQLSASYGSVFSTVFIHVSGLIAAIVFVLFQRQPKQNKIRIPWHLFIGGFIGVFSVYANIFTFAALGVSLTIALGLVGQCTLSLLIDTLGWFGMPKQHISVRRLLGLGIILCGIALMVVFNQGSEDLAKFSASTILLLVLGVLAGFSIVLSRMMNAKLAERIGVPKSTLANYVTGSALSSLIWLAAGAALPDFTVPKSLFESIIYMGGLLGIVVVAISNHISLKLSALVMTLLVFISQQGVGLLLDTLMGGIFPLGQFGGALLLIAGLLFYQSNNKKNNK